MALVTRRPHLLLVAPVRRGREEGRIRLGRVIGADEDLWRFYADDATGGTRGRVVPVG